jgi:hypothetical protein
VAGHFEFGQGADRYFNFNDDEGCRGWNAAIASGRLRLRVSTKGLVHYVLVACLRPVKSADDVVLIVKAVAHAWRP